MTRGRRHRLLATFLLLACGLALLTVQNGDSLVRALGRGLGYAGLGLLVLTLAIGPWSALRGRPLRTSSMLRRDLGIWVGIAGCLHAVLAWQSPVTQAAQPTGWGLLAALVELFLLAGDRKVGLVVAVILVGLLALSNNRALRALGPRRWKAWQRLAYLLTALTALHILAHQVIEARGAGSSVAVLALLAAMLLLRLIQRLGLHSRSVVWPTRFLPHPRG